MDLQNHIFPRRESDDLASEISLYSDCEVMHDILIDDDINDKEALEDMENMNTNNNNANLRSKPRYAEYKVVNTLLR